MSGTAVSAMVLQEAGSSSESPAEDHRTRVGFAKREKMRARLVAAIIELWPKTQSGISVVVDDVVPAAAV